MNDPARTVSVDDRISGIEKILKDHNIRFTMVDHFYNGPKENKVVTKHSFAEFPTANHAQRALTSFGGKGTSIKIANKDITINKAITAVNLKRNANLRSALKLINGSPLVKDKGRDVKLVWNGRKVTVDGIEVFSQDECEFGGSFSGEFAHLKLP